MIDAVTYGMIPSAKSEKREKRGAAEQVQEAEDGAAVPGEVRLDRGRVDARGGHPGAEPVGRENSSGKQHPAPKLRDSPCVREPGEQGLVLAFLFAVRSGLGLVCGLLRRSCQRGGTCVGGFRGTTSSSSCSSTFLGAAFRLRAFFTFGSRSRVSVPPAAETFSCAAWPMRRVRRSSASSISSPVPEQLDVLADRTDQAVLLQQLDRHLRPRIEAIEIAKVDRLECRYETGQSASRRATSSRATSAGAS